MNQTNNPKGRSTPASKSTPQKKPQKNQVSLAGVAKTSTKKETQPKKRNFPWKLVIFGVLLLLMAVGGMLLYWTIFGGGSEEQGDKKALTARQMVEYTYTPDALAGNVSYYLMGVTGAEIGDPMDMLAVMCYDRKADEVSVLQIPVATYIGKQNGFAVDTIGDVWYHPQPQIFCSACRERVPAEAQDGNVHITCGAALEERTGSATGDLIRVINEQYGLPIDNYFILSRQGFMDLIDAFHGVEIVLEKDVTLAGKAYAAGVHTLDGHAAADYAITYNYDKTAASDRLRMQRQRQVLASLWKNISAASEKDLYYVDDEGATKGILGKLMIGKNPIRFNSTSFGRARMLGIKDKAAEDIGSYLALARFVKQLSDVSLDKVTFSILPGVVDDISSTVKAYFVNPEQAIQLLNDQMNPYKLTVDEDTVNPAQIDKLIDDEVDDVDVVTEALDAYLPATAEEKGED